jgi:ATP/maltotriose-dependent transcriptional regulator MalT
VGAGLGAATSWVEGLQDELAKDRHTLVQIEQDRTAVLERIQAAELLLSTLEDEPEHWEVLQGGAHAGEVA